MAKDKRREEKQGPGPAMRMTAAVMILPSHRVVLPLSLFPFFPSFNSPSTSTEEEDKRMLPSTGY